jgi:glycosyltransferase involved in cell wall biosynthesis
VEVVALVERGERAGSRMVAPGLREIRVPKSGELTGIEFRMQQDAGVPVTDLMLALHHDLSPRYGAAVAASAADADAVVASHPFTAPAIAAAGAGPLVYEAHNVETDLKAAMLGDHSLAADVREVEGACCRSAHHVIVCTPDDGHRLGELFGLEPERAVVVPNGVDPAAVPFTRPEERDRRKAALGLGGSFRALFLGSWHEPNVVAARDVLAAAVQLPEVGFLVVGSVGMALGDDDIPPNVDVCGAVDGRFLASAMSIADVALNPMRFGSGTNLKMFDYALAGLPVISSAVGARGLGLAPGLHYLEAEPGDIAPALRALMAEPAERTAERVVAARELVRERFSWASIADAWLGSAPLRELVGRVPA